MTVDWRSLGDIPLATWKAELKSVGSPLFTIAELVGTFPLGPIFDLQNGLPIDAKHSSDLSAAMRFRQNANLTNLLNRQLCLFQSGMSRTSQRIKVVRAHACASLTFVVEIMAIRNRSNKPFVVNVMSHPRRFAVPQFSIPKLDTPLPDPARSFVASVFNGVVNRRCRLVVTIDKPIRLSLDATTTTISHRNQRSLFTATAVAKTVGNGIVFVRHLMASLKANEVRRARTVSAVPGSRLPELYHFGVTI